MMAAGLDWGRTSPLSAIICGLLCSASACLLSGCAEPDAPSPPPADTSAQLPQPRLDSLDDTGTLLRNPNRNAYFGDVHVHTRYSFDAYLFGTRATPDDAYRFAQGEALAHATGVSMHMQKPLDFQAVTDHGFYLGVMPEMAEGKGALSELPMAAQIRDIQTPADSRAAFAAAVQHLRSVARNPEKADPLDDRQVVDRAWQEIIAAAERHNKPGTFTTLIGYEYTTSGPQSENLHRNVLFRDAAPVRPFSRLDSGNPEELWAWMDQQREAGIEGLAIPHNSNASDGMMFDLVRFDGSPLDKAYAEMRMRNEPLVENTQVKGTSDTHPLLSPNDEWADFEIMPIKVARADTSRPPGSYVRHAYGRGLELQVQQGFNPYRFGVIGSSDTHNAAGSFEEDNYWSKTGVSDILPQQRGSVPLEGATEVIEDDPLGSGESGLAPDGRQYAAAAARYWGASGLAGVWAEANTRRDIYDAFRRKETFSTSGPHIQVRLFASQQFDSLLAADDPIATAYAQGVPMGGDLMAANGSAPQFFVWAAGDPDSAPLQRLQLIKGWVEEGQAREQVFDIGCADGEVDPDTHRCADVEATVDLRTCTINRDDGAAELQALWRDPQFDPAQHAYYYVRVLENPKCRWSTWDALRSGVVPRVDMPATLQDRAWSSPIWYVP